MFYKAAMTEADDPCRTNAADQLACGELTTHGGGGIVIGQFGITMDTI